MDEGVIRSLKAHYRKHPLRIILTHLNQEKPIPKILLLKTTLLVSTWNDVSKAVKKQSSTALEKLTFPEKVKCTQ